MFGFKSAAQQNEAFENAQATAINAGLVSGTKVATGMGWRAIEAIAEGDQVLTFDEGLQTVTKVERINLWSGQDHCPRQFWPLEVPAGALGNRSTMRVLPGQNIMVESDIAEDMYGDPFTLIPAGAVEGMHGVERTPPTDNIEIVILHFAKDQVVFSENGALFFCPASADMLQSAFAEEEVKPFYSVLTMDEARFLVHEIEEENTTDSAHSPQQGWSVFVPA